MTASLAHYKMGPANYQVATLIFGGQFVVPNTATPGTTDLTVKPAVSSSAAGVINALGVAGKDANVIATQTGAANTYGEPQIDLSVLDDFTSVYYGFFDMWVWYGGQAAPGDQLVIGTGTSGNVVNGCVASVGFTPFGGSTAITPAYNNVVARCTHPGGVTSAMLTQSIGGIGPATYFYGRARVLI